MTQLRTPTTDDFARLIQWGFDQELTTLDPPVGVVRNPLMWSIYTDDGVFIGIVTLYNQDGDSVELGIRIGEKSYWGQGHGTYAINSVLEFCRQMGMRRVHLKVIPTNARAIHVYEKCGFKQIHNFILDNIEFILMEVIL